MSCKMPLYSFPANLKMFIICRLTGHTLEIININTTGPLFLTVPLCFILRKSVTATSTWSTSYGAKFLGSNPSSPLSNLSVPMHKRFDLFVPQFPHVLNWENVIKTSYFGSRYSVPRMLWKESESSNTEVSQTRLPATSALGLSSPRVPGSRATINSISLQLVNKMSYIWG